MKKMQRLAVGSEKLKLDKRCLITKAVLLRVYSRALSVFSSCDLVGTLVPFVSAKSETYLCFAHNLEFLLKSESFCDQIYRKGLIVCNIDGFMAGFVERQFWKRKGWDPVAQRNVKQ